MEGEAPMKFIAAVPVQGSVFVSAPPARPQMAPELPGPYIQQVPPQPQQQPPPGAPPAAEPGLAPGDRVYGPEQVPPEATQQEEDAAAAAQLPPGYDPYADGAQPDYAAGEYDLSSDNAVAQSYDDGYDPQAAAQFQDALAPYGSWTDDPSYGRVWQ